MEGDLPPVKRFCLRHDGDGSEIAADSLLPKPILPAKKRIDPHQDYWLPDLNEPAASFCLPAKKRVWAFPPPLPPFESSHTSVVLDVPKAPPPIWAVKKKRTDKIVKKSQEKPEKKKKKPAERKRRGEGRWKLQPILEQPEEEGATQIEEMEEVVELVKGIGCMVEESEAEAAPELEEPADEEQIRAEDPVMVDVPQPEHLKQEIHVPMSSMEAAPRTEEQVGDEQLNVEGLAEHAPMTEMACSTAEVCVAGEDDDGVMCAVCRSTDGEPDDPIVFCDGCDLMVHASCYGNPLSVAIPEGDWFCTRCQATKEKESCSSDRWCCLCPAEGGVTKPTTDGRWAHVLCALLVPEVFFRDPEGRDGVDLSRVPARRWKRWCCLCGKAGEGCVVDCSESKCGLAFHVSCAMDADLCVEYRPSKTGDIVVGFCTEHTELWRKQQSTGRFKFVPRD